jgi:conjugal transfer pilus assembly protein TraK
VKGIRVGLVILLFAMCVSKALAMVVIEPSDAKSIFVTVSLKDINRIEMPEDVVEALSSKPIDVKVKGRNIFVKLLDSTPSELFITTEKRTISLILIPKDIPAETVIVRDKVEGSTSYTSGFTSSGMAYEETIKEIIFSLAREIPLAGYIPVYPKSEEETLWGLSAKRVYVIQGLTVQGEKYEIKNTSEQDMDLSEEMFYEEGVLAVSLSKYALKPNETARLFIVRRIQHGTKS